MCSAGERIAAKLEYKPSTEIKVNAQSNMIVECFVTGLPQPSVIWTKHGHPGWITEMLECLRSVIAINDANITTEKQVSSDLLDQQQQLTRF
jgi:hypothetical protein